MRGVQAANVGGTVRKLLEEGIRFATLEASAAEPWGHRATEQAVRAERVTGLPGLGWHNELHVLARREILPKNHVLARAVWVEQDQTQRVARVKMPEFIVRQPVKARETIRFTRVQTNDRGLDRLCRYPANQDQAP